MSGHSKWAGIKHRKAAVDAKRGKIFTRHAKLIEIAAREGGGGDPDANARLRAAIDSAKEDNVPNANIERAVKKGTGSLKGESRTESVVLEAFGPAGSAYIIECLTDNKNRTLSSVKAILARNGGRFAESGSVQWMFEQKGIIVATDNGLPDALAREALELKLIDAGAEDIDENGAEMLVVSGRESWPGIRDILKEAGFGIANAGLKFFPNRPVRIASAAAAKKILDLTEALEADEDVAGVHTNTGIDEGIAGEWE